MCDYIEYFDYDIAAFLKRDLGREYLKRSNMRESGIWVQKLKSWQQPKCFIGMSTHGLIISGFIIAI